MILLDYKDRRPIYEQVVEKLQELMICGGLEQNSQLPSVRNLAMDLSINPNTIQRAYAELERKGFIYSVKGKGSFVADRAQVRKLMAQELKDQLAGWLDQAKTLGITREEVQEWVLEGFNKGRSRV